MFQQAHRSLSNQKTRQHCKHFWSPSPQECALLKRPYHQRHMPMNMTCDGLWTLYIFWLVSKRSSTCKRATTKRFTCTIKYSSCSVQPSYTGSDSLPVSNDIKLDIDLSNPWFLSLDYIYAYIFRFENTAYKQQWHRSRKLLLENLKASPCGTPSISTADSHPHDLYFHLRISTSAVAVSSEE